MARYPCAQWAPVAWMNGLRHTKKTQLTVHITAGEGDPRTIKTWKPKSAGGSQSAGANFVIFRDGRTLQLADSRCKSAADNGATHTISVECVGAGGPLTAAQVRSLIRLIRDAHDLDGVPLRLAQTSSDAGIGWHRLGVDGAFPTGRHGGRLQRSPRGIKTSRSRGKACPTDAVIDQIYDVILPALTNDNTAKTTTEEDDMSAAAEKKIDELWDLLMPATKGIREEDGRFAKVIKETHDDARRAADAVTPGQKGVKHDGALYALAKKQGDETDVDVDVKELAAEIRQTLPGDIVVELIKQLGA
jgi:hypothetical protein